MFRSGLLRLSHPSVPHDIPPIALNRPNVPELIEADRSTASGASTAVLSGPASQRRRTWNLPVNPSTRTRKVDARRFVPSTIQNGL